MSEKTPIKTIDGHSLVDAEMRAAFEKSIADGAIGHVETIQNDVTYLSDGSVVETAYGSLALTTPFSTPLVPNASYTVIIDGNEYATKGVEISEEGLTAVVLGDVGLLTGGDSTGEPFIILGLSDGSPIDDLGDGVLAYGLVQIVGEGTGISSSSIISIAGAGEIEKVAPINLKFLGSLRGQKPIVITVDENGQFATDFLFETAWNMDIADLQSSIVIQGVTTDGIVGGSQAVFGVIKMDFTSSMGVRCIQFRVLNFIDYAMYTETVYTWQNGNSPSGHVYKETEIPQLYSCPTDDSAYYLGKHAKYAGWTARSIDDMRMDLGLEYLETYWSYVMDERIPQIRNAITAAGWNKSAFLWYHDIHWTYSYKQAPKLLKYLSDHTPINKTIFGGDVVDNEGDDTTTMSYLWDWRDAIRDIPNHHSVPGNHDDGNTIDNRFDDSYIYGYLLAAEETPDVVRGDSGLYYYIDDPAEKTRYLYLDTATKDGNIINDTVEQAWLKTTLKNTPDNWHIVAVAHIWRTVDYDVTPPADAGFSWGGKFCLDEFDAYNARTGEYADCKGKVEFCIGGHTHVDGDYYSDGGILVILTEGESQYVRSGLGCYEGDATASSVNAIVADYNNSVVNVIRIGRGESRVVPLVQGGDSGGDDDTGDTPVVPEGDFTNVLTAAGYTENTRYSTSSLADTTATGWDITGYIPATRNDVIRMVNVDFLDLDGGGGATSRAMIYAYDADKTYLTCSENYSQSSLMSEAWSAVYGDDGDLVQFTIPSSYSATVAYIRIGARNIDQYSVITVNEEIA